MRTRVALILFAGIQIGLLAGEARAQATLSTGFVGGNRQSGNMFDVVARSASGITIERLDVHVDTGVWDFEVYVLKQPGTWVGSQAMPSAWQLVGSVNGVLGQGIGVPTALPLSLRVFVPSGETRALYVTLTNGMLLEYTNGSAVGSVAAANTDLEILEGAGIAFPFGNAFTPRIWNGTVYYRVGPGPGSARSTAFGLGCGGNPIGEARHERMASFDLAGTSHSYAWNGSGYLLANGGGNFVAPTSTPMPFADDDTQTVALGFSMPTCVGQVTSVSLCSNGWLSFAPTAATDPVESEAALSTEPRLAFLWRDLDPGAGGTVHVEPAAGQLRITFAGVPEKGAGGANDVQVVLFDTGRIEVRYGACSLATAMVGVSPGGGVASGSVDYSALATLGPIVVTTGVAPFAPHLTLVSTAPPQLGATWDLRIDELDPVSPFGVTFVGVRRPAALLLDALGATGCRAYLDGVGGAFVANATGGSAVVSLPVPPDPVLTGLRIATQAAGLSTANAAGFVLSNGVAGVLGQ